MSNDLSQCRAVIVVVAMAGCPACEDYKPRLEREVNRWQQNGAPFVFGQKGQRFEPRQIPILLVDAESADPQFQAMFDDHQIVGLPTTILFMRGVPPQRQEGPLSELEIYQMLLVATRA